MGPQAFLLQTLQQLVNGLSLGSIYALIALGYTMVYGIIKLINFAHGDIFMVGAFAGYFATGVYKLSFLPALVLAMAVAAVTGMLIEFLAYRPIRKAGRIAALITAIGVSFLLENAGLLILKPDPRAFPEVIPLNVYDVGGIIVNNRQILILVVTVALMLLLQWVVRYTKIGKAMRAVANDREAAYLMGIDVDRVISVTFAIGSALAAAAGVLVGIFYNRIDPLMGIMPGLKAFVAAVLGGIGIIPGAMLGGFVMGIVEVLVVAFVSSSWKDAAAFVVLIFILLVRPAGLLGKNVGEKV
ncbi:MAG TPA: branched-chain amino acid ABC transporter permease [Firmicutes bacterium]|nr:branched-chain amino acid ABC transporter permease [Bacillota bacterium]